ncbi:alpha/beta hydrolase family protein [Macrococcus equipercicus]|uniref:S9 family peptidase n=1 Tax=Macrococcus equipercicus TaxID=69967 RepID=A0A9Q9BSP7_9STAP|nr:prolyl oligopeptidase family serine peptidase [Macrococcus equipercicus]KAA1039089.1 S9 family peptidase [Macrococcus equipercicus]UTH13266.1 S9 family peptidase [Macrococcus equipercicus]
MWLAERPVAAWYLSRQLVEVDYYSDEFVVSALLLEAADVRRIVIYLRGGKGGVGQVRPVRLMQFAGPHTLVAAPYYRGTRSDNGKDEFGGADLEDVRSLVRLLRENYGDVPIHLIGFSRGGIQGLLTYQDVGAASFICHSGVTDIYLMFEERHDLRGMMKRLIGRPAVDKEAYDRRNGYQHVTEMSPPVMIIHGTSDVQVGIQHAYILQQRLESLGVPYEMHIVEGEGHVFTPPKERETLKKIQEWMTAVEDG